MKPELVEHLEFVRGLAKILTESKLESLETQGVSIKRTKHVDAKIPKMSANSSLPDPTEDEIMSWALDEPIPPASALAKALSNEPPRQRKVRKDILGGS